MNRTWNDHVDAKCRYFTSTAFGNCSSDCGYLDFISKLVHGGEFFCHWEGGQLSRMNAIAGFPTREDRPPLGEASAHSEAQFCHCLLPSLLPSGRCLSGAMCCKCFVHPRMSHGFVSFHVALTSFSFSCRFYHGYYTSFSFWYKWRIMCNNWNFKFVHYALNMLHVLKLLEVLCAN